MSIVLEKDIERNLKKLVESRGGRCLKWVCPGWSGVPDRILLLPGAHVLFVETKRPKGGKASKLQEKWKKWLTDLGFVCFHVFNEQDLKALEIFLKLHAHELARAETRASK